MNREREDGQVKFRKFARKGPKLNIIIRLIRLKIATSGLCEPPRFGWNSLVRDA